MTGSAALDPGTPDLAATANAGGVAALRELAFSQLERIESFEDDVRAFAALDIDRLRSEIRSESVAGSLSGILFGAKDIIDTVALPTRYGSSLEELPPPTRDAWCIRASLSHGAILAGKTVTTELAFASAGPTGNPLDLARTPGGSSSGSAAAVAAGFVSFAFGTQTGGSIIRPASYTGIVGFKPTYGLLPLDGVHPSSMTFDHLGLLARSCRDVGFVLGALLRLPDFVAPPKKPQKVLLPRLEGAVSLSPTSRELVKRLPRALGDHGIPVEAVPLPVSAEIFLGLQETICYFEASRILLAAPGYRLSAQLGGLLRPYLDMPFGEYIDARRRREEHAFELNTLVGDEVVLAMPSALDVAPRGLASTGDAALNRLWTALHLPSLSVPLAQASGLPIGVQLVAGLGADASLLAIGQWLHERIPEVVL